jgi:cell division transport system permease protein
MMAPPPGRIPRSAYGLDDLWRQGVQLKSVSKAGRACQLAQQALRSLAASPLTSLLSLLTISVVLFLLCMLVLAVDNVAGFLRTTHARLGVSIYLKDAVSSEQSEKLIRELRSLPAIASAEFVSKSDALSIFRESLGEERAVLDGLEGDNPLPASIEVVLSEGQLARAVYDELAARFARNAAVERVQYNRGLVGEVSALLSFFRTVGLVSVGMMLLIAGFIIANTIRLALYARRHEISIMRLVGATAAFVNAPCLIEGAVLMYRLDFFQFGAARLHFLPWHSLLLIMAAGILVGMAGSYVAVRRFGDE